MKKKTAIIVIIASVLVIGGIIAAIYFLRNRSLGGYDSNLVYVESVRSVNGLPLGNSSRFMGIVESQDSKAVNKDSDKKVKEVFVKVGDTVKKGDKLFSYDTADMELTLEQLNIEKTSIQNSIDSLNTSVNDYSTQKSNASDQSEAESYNSQINSTNSSIKEEQVNLEKKELEIKKMQESIDNAVVTSPMNGVIKTCGQPDSLGDSDDSDTGMDTGLDGEDDSDSDIDFGLSDNDTDVIETEDTSNGFVTIIAEGDYKIRGITDEMNIHNFTSGTAVILRSRTDESQTWKGTIEKVDMEPRGNSDSDYYDSGESASNYNFYVTPENTEDMILGQHLFIELDYGQGEKVSGVQLPSYFIMKEEDGTYVWKRGEEGNIEKAKITVGEYDEAADTYEITEGLTLDDYIAYPDERVNEGDPTTTNYDDITYEDEESDGEDLEDLDDVDSEDFEIEEDEDSDSYETEDEESGLDDSFVVTDTNESDTGDSAEQIISDPGVQIDSPADVDTENQGE